MFVHLIAKTAPALRSGLFFLLRELKPTTPQASKVENYTAPRLTQVRESLADFKNGKPNFATLSAEDGK